MMDGALVTSEAARRTILGVPTWVTVKNWLLSGCVTVAVGMRLLKLLIGLLG